MGWIPWNNMQHLKELRIDTLKVRSLDGVVQQFVMEVTQLNLDVLGLPEISFT
jgi:hypothetical protein